MGNKYFNRPNVLLHITENSVEWALSPLLWRWRAIDSEESQLVQIDTHNN